MQYNNKNEINSLQLQKQTGRPLQTFLRIFRTEENFIPQGCHTTQILWRHLTDYLQQSASATKRHIADVM